MSDTKISEPAPNWCRTCGRRPNDPMAALCLDTHHRTLERLHPQPAELAEQQEFISDIYKVASTPGMTPVDLADWVRDALLKDGHVIAATGKQQVGEVQALRARVAHLERTEAALRSDMGDVLRDRFESQEREQDSYQCGEL